MFNSCLYGNRNKLDFDCQREKYMSFSVTIRTTFFRYAEVVHLRLFGHPMSETMRAFLGNLSWSFFGGIIASGIMFVVHILAGRWLGPEEYGKYNAISSFAAMLSILYLFGMDTSSVRYLSGGDRIDSSKKIFTTTLFFVIFMQVTITLFFILWYKFFSHEDFISEAFLFLGIFFAIIISFKSLFHSFLRAFNKYEQQCSLRIFDSIFVIIVFCVLTLIYQWRTASSYAYSFIIGGGVFIVFSLWILRKNIFKFDFSLLKKIFIEYNRYVLVMSLIGMVFVSDKLIIGKVLGLEVLGYYSAYYAASHLFVSELGGIFMNVFWPSVIKNVDSLSEILRKTTRLLIFYSPLWIFLFSLSTFILFSFFGKEYPLRYDYIILFSMSAFFGVVFSIFMSFLNIHHIQKSIVIFLLFVFFSIVVLVLMKNITLYLSAQIIFQALLIWYMWALLLKKNYEKI